MSLSGSLAPSTTNPTPSVAEFVILGSGVSTAIPRISCIIRRDEPDACTVCRDALQHPSSRNRRCNVAALVRRAGVTVLIDCGKTIRESAMRHFPRLGVRSVDAIVLTHGHADAVLGLDDARDIQVEGATVVSDGPHKWRPPEPTPVFLNSDTMRVCSNVFPYLVPRHQLNRDSNHPKNDIPRRVAALTWMPYDESAYFKPFHPIEGAGIEFIPIPMLHGGEYICMGFLITIAPTSDTPEKFVAYLSDLNELPQRSMDFLKAVPRIDLLVVDILTNSSRNRSHFCKHQAIDLARELRPSETVAVGMTCSIGMHHEVNAALEQLEDEGLKFRLAYDGERFPC